MYLLTSLLASLVVGTFAYSLSSSVVLDWNRLGYQLLYGYSYVQIACQRSWKHGYQRWIASKEKNNDDDKPIEIQVSVYSRHHRPIHESNHVLTKADQYVFVPMHAYPNAKAHQKDKVWVFTNVSSQLKVVVQSNDRPWGSPIQWIPTSYKFLSVAITVVTEDEGEVEGEDEGEEQEVMIDLTPYYVVDNVIDHRMIKRLCLCQEEWTDTVLLTIIDQNANLIQLFPGDSLTLGQHDYTTTKQTTNATATANATAR